MTEEEIKALQDELEAKKAEAEQWKTAANKHETDKNKVVEELIAERQKKQEALDKANLSNTDLDVPTIVENTLRAREEERKKRELEAAMIEFKASKPEFQSDVAGIVFSKFQDGLKRFNFSDVESKEQYKQRLEEAYRFLNNVSETNPQDNYDGTPFTPTSPGDTRPQQKADVKSALEISGVSEERFKQLKEKFPEAMENIGLA